MVLVFGAVPLYANDDMSEEVQNATGSAPDPLEIIQPSPLLTNSLTPSPLTPREVVERSYDASDLGTTVIEPEEQGGFDQTTPELSNRDEPAYTDAFIEESSQTSTQLAQTSELTASQLATIYNPDNYHYDFVPGEVLVGMNSGFATPQSAQGARGAFNARGALSAQSAESLFPELNVASIEDLYQSARDALPMSPTMSANSFNSAQESRTVYLVELALDTKESVLDAIEVLKQNPNVAYAEPNYISYPCATPNDEFFDELWGMTKIQAPEAWDLTTGSQSVRVGVIDTGFDYTHPDLAANIDRSLGYWPTWNTYGYEADIMDYFGHGTHVAGTIGAVGNNSIGVAGVNWNVTMIPIKIVNSNYDSRATLGRLSQSIIYASELGLPITSLSYSIAYSQTLINATDDYNGLFVIAADNSSSNKDEDLMTREMHALGNVIFVANSKQDDTLRTGWEGSSYGINTVALAAPGTDIYSTTIGQNRYRELSGTSMAAPHVSGAAALVLSYAPHLTTEQLKESLLTSVDVIPSLAPYVSTGGRLNVYNAIANLSPIAASPIDPNFGSHQEGYIQRPTQTITISNRGSQNVTLNPLPTIENWTLVQEANWTIALEPNQTRTFTIRPNDELAAGTYEPTITVTGSGGANAQVKPSFTVTLQPVILPTSVTIMPKPVAINIGESAQLTATVLPANATDKSITWTSSNPSVAAVNALGLVSARGMGQATITAKTENGLIDTCEVTADIISLSLTQNGNREPYVFPALRPGYTNTQSMVLTLTNTGNRAISSLFVAVSGVNSGSFSVVPGANFASIEPGATRTITVSPHIGLAPGTYTADIAVEGDSTTSNSMKVSFTVLPAQLPHSIELDTAEVNFPSVDPGYRAPSRQTIRVTNDGTLATGALTISLSGSNASSFTLSRTRLASIAVGRNTTFTVVPRTGLSSGVYTATVTVRGANNIERSFDVRFEVKPNVYSVTLNATVTSFPDVGPGYRAPSRQTIRVYNNGNQPTGALTVSLDGANASSFTISRTRIANIAVAREATFTVVPRTGLAAGTHEATITVRGANGIERSSTVKLVVNTAIYHIGMGTALSYSSIDFPSAAIGYRAQSAQIVGVLNLGNMPTGALSVSLSGTNATSFSISRTSLASIAADRRATFTIVPRTGLAAGTHEAILTVRGAHGIESNLPVRFTVNPAVYSVALYGTPVDFPSVGVGYRAQSSRTVSVHNNGNQATGALTLSLSGTNAASFTLSRTSLASIAVGNSPTFTVVPRTGLAAGNYEATVTIRGATGIEQSFPVTFTVNPAVYSAALNTTAIEFPAANVGYRAQSAQTIRVTNDGNQATGALTIALSGANAARFTLSRTSLASIALGASSTFTVVPRTGLAAGSYEALVTVRGANGISEALTVSFTVR